MAEQTELSPEEQSAIYHAHSFKICTQMVADWTKTLGEQTPIALCGAIDAFAQGLIVHIGEEAALKFLHELASELRKRGDDARKLDLLA